MFQKKVAGQEQCVLSVLAAISVWYIPLSLCVMFVYFPSHSFPCLLTILINLTPCAKLFYSNMGSLPTAYKCDGKPAQSVHSRLGPHRAVLSLSSVDKHHYDHHPCKNANGGGVPQS